MNRLYCSQMTITEISREMFDKAIEYAFVATPYAEALEGWCEDGLCYLGLCLDSRESALADLKRRFRRSTFHETIAPDRYDGAITDRICLVGTEFQRAVWRELLNIPCGERISYGELARRLGRSSGMGVRAVGQAVGANPIGLIVPCHRVVGADGSMHGYFWGTDVKRRILDDEAGEGKR